MKYIKQLSTYIDLQTQISVQFPWRGLWHFTMFCKEIIYFIQGPPTKKDIFLLWDISAFFPSVFFYLKELWFFDSHPFHWRNYKITNTLNEVLFTWSPNDSQNTCDCQQTCWENDPIQRLHTYVANYWPSHWVGIGWKIPYFALNGSTVFLFSFGKRFKYNT